MVTVLLNVNAHFLKAGNGREAVRTLEEIVDSVVPLQWSQT